MKIFGAYLEDYHLIKLIIPTDTKFSRPNLRLLGGGHKRKLTILSEESFGNEWHLHLQFQGKIMLHIDYRVWVNDDLQFSLFLGKITRTARFDYENYYEGPLGIDYQKDRTIFRLWSPVAKEIILNYANDISENQIHLKYIKQGCWEASIEGDLDGFSYYYLVRINNELVHTLDPYAISTGVNQEVNYVINWDKTYEMKYPYQFKGHYQDAIIYEINVRDWSIERFKSSKRRSFYLEAIRASSIYPDLGLKYLLRLGITHVQLMPIFSFGGVDENDQKGAYNWGYNPIAYNSPSLWHAEDVMNPYGAINELKEMIDGFHQVGIAINLDIVYNHVYDNLAFSWAKLVPGYFFRYDKRGFLMDASGCGNDIATTRRMVKRFIIDSVSFWAQSYHVDGFRFDLMGLMDTALLNELANKLKNDYPSMLLYGEGWIMETGLSAEKNANVLNHWQLLDYAFFNDRFRDIIRGSPFKIEAGYAMGRKDDQKTIEMIIKASSSDEWYFSLPSQALNYLECHDNYTFYDQLIKLFPNLSEQEQKDYLALALSLLILSQGIPFIHGGQEFFRTKQGINNSYCSSDEINRIDWQRQIKYDDMSQVLSDLISLRQDYSIFRLRDLLDKVIKSDHKTEYHTLIYRLKDNVNDLQIIIKNNYDVEINYFAPGTSLIFDGKKRVNQAIDHLVLDHPALYVLTKNK